MDRLASYTNPIWIYNPDHAPEQTHETLSLNATITHMINPKTYYDFKINYFDTFRENYDRAYHDDIWAYGDPRYNPLPSPAA